ncbi:hypothetical protein Sta7437_4637 (plasmid) [Stanieria cyanosphaera PCC 7437]|uniref:Uncharacterized protein n=1 Tax=Stanieria cyanosphaera (strain ATCC 29371 / PCC 7437) TaxID=111780 RepID=K9Y1A0_STAC7|nr:hypothetical protein [Stanieria cyanosphaera]AFZ38094.1 hypothetical protein Sta7437_4637 [Stanieria cyanosphaera PCC 7437]
MTDTLKIPEPYDLEKCTVKIVLLLHPCKTNSNEPDCTIAVSTHEDIPLTKIIKRSQLSLPEPIKDLLAELKADLPQREFHARVKQSKTSKQKTTHTNKSDKTSQPNESNTSTIKQVQLF